MAYTLPHLEAQPPRLNPVNVPEAFRHLIPLAEKYGIADDCYRDEVIESLTQSELMECAAFLEFYEDILDEWLAGPEAVGPDFSNEYIAFSALGMAAELAQAKLDNQS